jgi:hypothetical protein
MTETKHTTRRGALGRMLVGAGALVGIGAGVAAARGTGSPPAAGLDRAAPHTETVTFHARDLRSTPALHDPRGGGSRADAPFGQLVDAALRPVGEFRAGLLPTGGSLHTFTLGDAQLFGVGAGGLEGTAHAVVGGTGRFAGASGSYVVEPAAAELASSLPGRSLTITLTLTAWEA